MLPGTRTTEAAL